MSTPITLKDSSAFRDLGGLPTEGGRRLRAGRLYRSDALAAPVAEDRALIGSLGLRFVCDLRSAAERRARPCLDWLSPAPRVLHLELAPALDAGTAAMSAELYRARSATAARALMRRTYEVLPSACAPRLGELFGALRAGEIPALIHCSAGKDRTGFAVAMVLCALGVPRPAILADYLLAARPEHIARAHTRTAEVMQLVLGEPLEHAAVAAMSSVEPELLDASFAAIEREHGGIEAYLREVAGLDAAARHELQSMLLEDDRGPLGP